MKVIYLIVMVIALFIFLPSQEIPQHYQAYFTAKKSVESSKLRATFLGVSSLLIQDSKNNLLIDGFITRPSKTELLFTKIQTNEALVAKVLDKLKVNTIDAIFTLHSHHDHAMDIGFIASKTDAKIIGSASTLNIARAYKLNENQLQEVNGKTVIKIGDFTITVIPSKHTKISFLLSKLVGMGEEITHPMDKKEHLSAYKESHNYALHIAHPQGNLFINGSTGYIEKMTQGYKADTVFLGTATFGKLDTNFQEAYYEELVTNIEAKTVVPIHWDDFTKSIQEPIVPLPKLFDDFEGSMEFLIEKSMVNKTDIVLMDFFDTIEVGLE